MMLFATFLFLLYLAGSGSEAPYRVINGMEGQGVHIVCEYSTALRPPTLVCCKLTSEHTCEPTVSGSAHVTGSKVRLSVYLGHLSERDSGEYWCGIWTLEGSLNITYVAERILLRVLKAGIPSGVPREHAPPVNLTAESAPEQNSNISLWNIIPLLVAAVVLVPFLVVFAIAIRRLRNAREVGDTETVSPPPQDSITMCKFSSRTETVIDDITYAVLTLHSPASPAEGSYANMQPRESSDQPHPQTEDVEYSSIVF
ncbi:CMRF35-like molecule 8 isoform X1 [Huso huso]|uniref:CMRF35-like molecule 8 isoform X1 n=1 Tax=Huso huso TaxID=61971 RepID=A0ABR0YDP5_HUSHU